MAKPSEAFKALPDDERDTITGFSGREKNIIYDSWVRLQLTNVPDVTEADKPKQSSTNIDLVLWLFDNVPNMRDRFNKFDANQPGEEIKGDEMFLAHAQVLSEELYNIVRLLPTPELMMKRIEALAHSHVNRPERVGSKYFGAIHKNFHRFVSKRLSEPEDGEICQLWTALFGLIHTVIKAEEEKLGPDPAEDGKKTKKTCCIIV